MNALNQAIYSRLQTTGSINSLLAGTTAIYHMQAPAGQAYPYIVFSSQSEVTENRTPHRTDNDVIFIRAYSAVSAAQAGSIDARIDTAVHLVPLTVSGWTNYWLAREQGLATVETEPSARPIYMQGAMYRVRLDKT